MINKSHRPKHLNLFKIRLPMTGIVSINHRVSGVFLFLTIPFSIYLLQLSLSGAEGFAAAVQILSQQWLFIPLVILFWSFIHHLMAGFRFLLIDLSVGSQLKQAKLTAWIVVVGAIVATLIFAGAYLV